MKRRQRSRIIERVEHHLRYAHSPRIHMTLILLVTGLSGFLFSYTLLHMGLEAMWLRYPIAVALAYGVFLGQLRVWLTYQLAIFNRAHPRRHGSVDDVLDVLDASADLLSGFGDSGGGGAAATTSDVLDPDETIFLVVAIIAVFGAALAVFYVVYAAPALLAEVFVDGVLVAGLYRRLKKQSQGHWMYGALRHTCIPALLTVLLFSVAGFAMQKLDPGAKSIGHVCQRILGHQTVLPSERGVSLNNR